MKFSMKKVTVLLADGFEEIEALTVVDLLRRAKVYVDTVSITDDYTVRGAHGIPVQTEDLITEIDFKESDMIVLPGGMPGTTNLSESGTLKDHIIKYNEQGKWLAAICAAPSIFSSLGILKDKKATSFPSFADKMDCKEYGGGVVRDGNIITGKGLGVALELGLELISCLIDEETSGKIADQIQYN